MKMPKLNFLPRDNWGLRLLALVLAIVVYYVLKTETVATDHTKNERHIFQYR